MANKGIIIIPAYNEEQDIKKVIKGLKRNCKDLDLIFINDGSKDRTGPILQEHGCDVLSHPINMGYNMALQTGIDYALRRNYDFCVLIDADNQHNPEDITLMRKFMTESSADVVIGSRFIHKTGSNSSLSRRIGMIFFSYLSWLLTKTKITDTTSGFKVLNRSAMELVKEAAFGDFHSEIIIYLLHMGMKIVEFPIKVKDRTAGNSMYSFKDFFIYPMKTLLAILIALLKAYFNKRRS